MNCRSKMPAVHHIHVKIGKDVYTISHDGAYVAISDLITMVNQIISNNIDLYFRDQNIEKKDK